jgi:hypothetical protein
VRNADPGRSGCLLNPLDDLNAPMCSAETQGLLRPFVLVVLVAVIAAVIAAVK